MLLFPTTVPDDLALPAVDVDSVFGAQLVARAARYERFLYVDWVLAQITLLVVLAIYARRGVAFMRESSAGPIGTGMLLGMLGLAIAWLVRIPFRVAAHWWDRRYDQTDLDYLSWLVQDWAVLAAAFVSICFALLIVMGLARWLGERWWLPGAAVFVAIAALFSFVVPYLDFGTTHPLQDESLLAAADRYERELGLAHIPLRVEDVSQDTQQANAYAIGIGPSRRVVFWDTLLQKPFTTGERQHDPRPRARPPLERPPAGRARLVRDLRRSERVAAHARNSRPRRDGTGRGGASRTPRRRRHPARRDSGAELPLATHGGRGRLGRPRR